VEIFAVVMVLNLVWVCLNGNLYDCGRSAICIGVA